MITGLTNADGVITVTHKADEVVIEFRPDDSKAAPQRIAIPAFKFAWIMADYLRCYEVK